MVKNFLILPLMLLFAQKPAEKPKVHADFQFGSFPTSRTGEELMKSDLARQVIVAYHEGWNLDKISKTLKVSLDDVSKVSDKLEDERLGGRRDEFDIKPFFPVIREQDFLRVKDPLRRHTEEFAKVLTDNWKDIEALVDSLDGMKAVPKDRAMYETIVSGILFGGMLDAFYEDQTMMPAPPRHAKNERYYAWLVESNPPAAGKLKRELRESANYRIITIGGSLPADKLNADDLRGKAVVLDEAEARKYRAFIGIFTRDKLLPYFKSRRPEFLKEAQLVQAGRYVAFAQVFAWFYDVIANGITDSLVASKRIAPPETLYTYAVRVPQ
jgi:hypothetical protein